MKGYKDAFLGFTQARENPNEHEIHLFSRAQKYIKKIAFLPGIEMIAVVNSLSYFGTHKDSDIDLFIVTKPDYMWFTRLSITLIFSFFGVWRKGKEVKENFCLSFFVTTDAIDLEKIAIKDDVYLYYWIYFMKPIVNYNQTYERFLTENNWVEVEYVQRERNKQFLVSVGERKSLGAWKVLDKVINFFGEKKAKNSAKNIGNPAGIIISPNMLKFHNEDRREYFREHVLKIKI